MARSRGRVRNTGVMLALGAAAALFASCSETPTAPEFINPFDPNAPGFDGNPLDLSATYDEGTGDIKLLWTHPSGFGITSYEIRHATEPQGPFESVASVAAPATGNIATYAYAEPERNAVNYFLVVGSDGAGHTMATSDLTPVSRVTPPLLAFADRPTATTVASRYQRLTVATSRGDSAVLADNFEFTGPSRVVREAIPGAVDTVAWDFGPRGQGDTLTVYLQVITGGAASLTSSVKRIVRFAPGFDVVGMPATLASNVVDLTVDTLGVERMRFALSQEELASLPWLEGATVASDFVLGDALQPQTIFGEFEGDFGVDTVTTTVVTPDDLSEASFAIVGLGADRITEDSTLELECEAVATQMRFAPAADFAGTDWIPYADSYVIDVGAGAGERVIYGQFRNHWIRSAILTDWYIQVGQPLEVAFLAPADSAVLRGGTGLLTRGLARAEVDGPEIDRVEIFIDGATDWEPVSGTTAWEYFWSIPRFDEDTWLNLRARAITAAGESAPDTATTAVVVLVTQLVVTILGPADGAELEGGAPTTIGGTAVPAFDGAPMDSVVVLAGDQRLKAPEPGVWSVDWTPSEVAEPTPLEIIATLYAGMETVADTVGVTIVPSE